jgi:Skp family chaperone for outer membrane proteins
MREYHKILLGAAIGALIAGLLAPTFVGAAGSTVGVIDLEKAIQAHPLYETNKEQLESYTQEQEARLDVYRSKDVITEADKPAIVNLRKEIDENIAAKAAELSNQITEEVLNAVIKVGQEARIEAILDANVVLYGGMDFTQAVINELNG